jgi:hypothetical protein
MKLKHAKTILENHKHNIDGTGIYAEASSLLSEALEAVISFLNNRDKEMMRQCDCGGYRAARLSDNEWCWTAGCQACDRIKMLTDTKIVIIKDSEKKNTLVERGIASYSGKDVEKL